MTFLQALRKIRPMIESGDEHYICFALEQNGAGEYVENIEAQLGGPSHSYSGWLARHNYGFYQAIIDSTNDFRPGRLAWIDDMIAKELAK